jgi:hypothetical protein
MNGAQHDTLRRHLRARLQAPSRAVLAHMTISLAACRFTRSSPKLQPMSAPTPAPPGLPKAKVAPGRVQCEGTRAWKAGAATTKQRQLPQKKAQSTPAAKKVPNSFSEGAPTCVAAEPNELLSSLLPKSTSKYSGACSKCDRIFTHAPALTIHQRSCDGHLHPARVFGKRKRPQIAARHKLQRVDGEDPESDLSFTEAISEQRKLLEALFGPHGMSRRRTGV